MQTEELDEAVAVYNINVADYHTYHVGHNNILVHNKCIQPTCESVKNPNGSTTYTKTIDGKEVSVTYNAEGYPDFSPYAETLPNGNNSVSIDYTGSRRQDFKLADKLAGFSSENPRPAGTPWHHCEDMHTMQLVPSNIQNLSMGGFAHSGGIEIWQRMTGVKYKP